MRCARVRRHPTQRNSPNQHHHHQTKPISLSANSVLFLRPPTIEFPLILFATNMRFRDGTHVRLGWSCVRYRNRVSYITDVGCVADYHNSTIRLLDWWIRCSELRLKAPERLIIPLWQLLLPTDKELELTVSRRPGHDFRVSYWIYIYSWTPRFKHLPKHV